MTALGRRHFVVTSMKAAGLAFVRAPAIIRQDATRPVIAHGTAVGDVTGGRAIVWARSDRPARMHVAWSTTESFQNVRRTSPRNAVAQAATGLTARIDLQGLPPGQRIHYQVSFEDLADGRNTSLPAAGSFVTAPATARDVTFAWSGDTVGQGWGINAEWGGLRMYDTIRRARPDFFVHCGDTIYADAPLSREVTLPDGTIWKNLVTPAKEKVAETLDEFRGNHLYNLLDAHVRAFNAEVPQIVLWDDHEVRNNWFPTMDLAGDTRYQLKDPSVLIANARRAFLEHVPIRVAATGDRPIFRVVPHGPLLDVFALDLRTYRGANSANRQESMGPDARIAGTAQMRWLKDALRRSTATWKVIASDQPLGLVIEDMGVGYEAVANGDGPPLGRELEIADLLRFIKAQSIRNVVWLTADVHYTAAHHYDPDRARFKDFHPFWEFVSGPLHAGTGMQGRLDDTFGPEARFVRAADRADLGPAAGLQFFGTVSISAASRAMDVRLHDVTGATLHTTTLEPGS